MLIFNSNQSAFFSREGKKVDFFQKGYRLPQLDVLQWHRQDSLSGHEVP